MPLPLLVVLAGCDGQTPQEKEAQDARDVAQVVAAQTLRPPVQPIVPEPITRADFAEVGRIARPADAVSQLPGETVDNGGDGKGCAFVPRGAAGGAPVFAADVKRGLMKLGGDLVVLAVDSGSPELAPGLHARYLGREYMATIARSQGDRLTVFDRYDRVVYSVAGVAACTAR